MSARTSALPVLLGPALVVAGLVLLVPGSRGRDDDDRHDDVVAADR